MDSAQKDCSVNQFDRDVVERRHLERAVHFEGVFLGFDVVENGINFWTFVCLRKKDSEGFGRHEAPASAIVKKRIVDANAGLQKRYLSQRTLT